MTAARPIRRTPRARWRPLLLLAALLLAIGLLPAPATGQDTGQDDGGSVTPARVEGQARVETAANLARLTFEQADVAHLVRVDDFPDALAASFGAGAVGGPILLTPREEAGVGGPDTPTSPTVQAMEDLDVQRVVLVGGQAAIDEQVARELREAGYEVDRIGGVNRYQTASSVAMRYGTEVGVGELEGDRTALLASGATFADALAAGPVAARAGFPLFLTPPDGTEVSVNTSLQQLEIQRVVVVGGQAAVAPEVVEHYQQQGYTVERWAGPTRTATAAVVADNAVQRLGFDPSLTLLARGDDFADALAASAHGGANAAPLLLTASPDTLSRDTLDWLEGACPGVEVVRAIGGTAAITESTLAAAVQAAEACQEPGGQRCTNPDDGFTVTYPFTWSANGERIDEIAPCSLFDPDPTSFDFEGQHPPADIGAQLFVDPVDFEDVSGAGEFEEEVDRRDATVDGRRAERLETRATGEGMHPEGTLTTRWAVDLGGGETFLAITRSLGEPEYAQKVAVLDAMVESLTFVDDVDGDGGWAALPPAPIEPRINHTATWTGEEMLIWGGGDAGTVAADGAAWNPGTGRWRAIPEAPIEPRWSHQATWTGQEVLVWGGSAGPDHLAECFGDGAAYAPGTDSWRVLADAPGDGRCGATSVWTEEELIIYGGHSSSGPPQPGDYADDAIAYDPTTDTWRSTPPAPITPRTGAISAWTGQELLVYGGTGPDFEPLADGAAYDPTTDAWRPLADSPLEPRAAISGVWLDERWLVFGGQPGGPGTTSTEAAIYDPATDTWQGVADMPAGHTAPTPAAWTGSAAHVVGGDTGTDDAPAFHSYVPDDDMWVAHPSPPQSPRLFHTLVWTGEQLIVWGGEVRPGGGPAGGAAWTPVSAG